MSKESEILMSGFVTEGTVILRTLGYEGITAPVPDEESAVISLIVAGDGKVCGLTKGKRSHLFVYNNWPIEDCVVDIGVIAENTIGGDLVSTSKGEIFGMVWGKSWTKIFSHNPSAVSIGGEGTLSLGKINVKDFAPPLAVISKLTKHKNKDIIYGIAQPDNTIFSYDIQTEKYSEIFRSGNGVISKVLCTAPDGMIYGVGENGRVFKFSPDERELQTTNMFIPCGKGKEYVSEATVLVADAGNKLIYGGTLSDGYLFKINLEEEQVICLGKPVEQRPIRCLTIGHDGKVFGIAGERNTGICHLFRHDPQSGDLRDLGIVRSTIAMAWVAHEIDAICTGRNGQIILGETDRMSHLMIYYPPI